MFSRLSVLMLSLAFAAGACRKARPEFPPIPSPDTTPSGFTPAATSDDADARRRAEEERLRAEREAAARAAAEASLRAAVYFAYDQSELDAEARAALDAKLTILRNQSPVQLRIEGHTDERGSDEYNLALGFRRATAAKRYLTDRGIPDARLEVTSFGEERPTCTDATDACWQRNRRAEFHITAGLDTPTR